MALRLRRLRTGIGRQLLSRGFGQLGLHRIFATCDPRNLGSARVLAKLGMTYEGHLRHTAWIRDGWRDSLTFSILEEEWRAEDVGVVPISNGEANRRNP
ncbi:GNAT family N-acetyltransferase [Streptomyces sp. IB201691-2A2]|uniref:GNAT family N-acetyltransferase n=1 Tax=Streptomyces sp. IB201691-2A2 TaxID=2561920 RepID=UPI0037D9DEC1